MDLLIQLGVNHTLAVQLVMFLVTFVILKYVLFEPYYAAFNERQERTVGRTELADPDPRARRNVPNGLAPGRLRAGAGNSRR